MENKITRFISGISLEIYLSHMVIFRVVEKVGLHRLIGDGWLQYGLIVAVVLVGTVIFAVVMQKILENLNHLIKKSVLVQKLQG